MAPDQILKFWLDETAPEKWYSVDLDLDAEIKHRFEPAWCELMQGRYGLWLTYPSGALAYIILADQFSRNMFRGQDKGFSSDTVALAASKSAINQKWDLRVDEPARQFFYLPLMHSENLIDQDRCVRLLKERMCDGGGQNLLHARAHREVIRNFGRFPDRNSALSRKSSQAEADFIRDGGYGNLFQNLTVPI